MLIYVKIIKIKLKFFFLIYVNFMIIYVIIEKKMFFIAQTDRRTTQNYSSQPHKIISLFTYNDNIKLIYIY